MFDEERNSLWMGSTLGRQDGAGLHGKADGASHGGQATGDKPGGSILHVSTAASIPLMDCNLKPGETSPSKLFLSVSYHSNRTSNENTMAYPHIQINK